jgi:hypothetical protein
MEIIIQQLLSSYCRELNEGWLETAKDLDDQRFNYEAILPFVKKFREAESEGYTFELVFCPLQLIDKTAPGCNYEEQMMTSSAWNDVDFINRMKEESKKNQWIPIDNPLDKLRIEKIKTITGEFLQHHTSKNGPFFPSKDPSTILVYCLMGSIAKEVTLLSLIQSKKFNNETKRHH